MSEKEKVYEALDKMGIKYDVVDHPPALTTEEADLYIEGKEGVRSKTMFMTNKKKKNFYLFILDESKRLDMKKLGEIIGEKTLKFAHEEHVEEKLGLKFGVVSPFGLLNNKEKDVKVYVDREIIKDKIITFHPNENIATLFISFDDLFKFFENIGINYEIIDM